MTPEVRRVWARSRAQDSRGHVGLLLRCHGVARRRYAVRASQRGAPSRGAPPVFHGAALCAPATVAVSSSQLRRHASRDAESAGSSSVPRPRPWPGGTQQHARVRSSAHVVRAEPCGGRPAHSAMPDDSVPFAGPSVRAVNSASTTEKGWSPSSRPPPRHRGGGGRPGPIPTVRFAGLAPEGPCQLRETGVDRAGGQAAEPGQELRRQGLPRRRWGRSLTRSPAGLGNRRAHISHGSSFCGRCRHCTGRGRRPPRGARPAGRCHQQLQRRARARAHRGRRVRGAVGP